MTIIRPTRILVVSDEASRQGEMERLLGHQYPLRLVLADTANAVSRLFAAESVDMLLVFPTAEEPELLAAALRCIRDTDPPVPLVAAIEPDDARTALSLATHGIDGFVSADSERRLSQIVHNQIKQILSRREARQAAVRLDEIENRYTLLLESSSEAIAYIHEGLHIFANPAYLKVFGFESFEEVEGLSMLDLLAPGDANGLDLKQTLKALDRGELPNTPLSLNGQRDDGAAIRVIATFSPARFNGESCAQMLIREDHPEADPALAEELKRLKQTDLVTGFLNQAAFVSKLDDELALRSDATRLSILLMSLDQVDRLQSRVGIGASDHLIREAGKMLAESVGENLALARLRDHIFAVLVESEQAHSCEQLAHAIVESCHGKILELGEISLPVTVSVGVAQGTSGEARADGLIAQADLALSEALRSGGNAYVRYRPRLSGEASDDDMAWHERLIHALDHDEIRLMSSAITRMDDDSTTIYEIESRMRAEDSDEVVLPSVFIGAAARVGLAPRLDKDLLRRLTGLITARQSEANEAWLVTLSLESVGDQEFCDHLEGLLNSEPLDSARLIWAFRDFEMADRLRQAQDFVERFRPFGCQFALTDVGPESTVEATLAYLNLAYLRLAPEMVQSLGENEALRDKLTAIVSAAKQANASVIAPRVDHASDLATLWQLGITLVQGDFVRENASR